MLAAALLVGAAAVVYWLAIRGDGQSEGVSAKPTAGDELVARRMSAPRLTATDEQLYEGLNEDHETLASGIVIESIDTDRQWVCTGEPMRMTAKLGGETVDGAVARWVWTEMGGARLHPGDSIFWDAPAAAGDYEVRFQMAKDLGGRKVGVLAERKLRVTVRDCGEDELQESEPLRLGAVQKGHGKFEFQVSYQGDDEVADLSWDFGDEQHATTTALAVEHTYDVSDLGPQDTRNYTVKVTARLRGGASPSASTIAFTGGRPNHDPPKVLLAMDRWSFDETTNKWTTPVSIKNPTVDAITWTKLERVTKFFDDSHDIQELPWDQAIQVIESLEGGGFSGQVVIDASEVPPEVKQIIDRLHGEDDQGEEVIVSWTPFKRAGDAPPTDEVQGEPPKSGSAPR